MTAERMVLFGGIAIAVMIGVGLLWLAGECQASGGKPYIVGKFMMCIRS